MIGNENTVCTTRGEYKQLVEAKKMNDAIKIFLLRKFKNYAGITHSELEMLCDVCGFFDEGEGEF